LMRATGVGNEETNFCAACFTGDYPCEVPERLRSSKFRYEESACGAPQS
jgi:glutamine phosphoribosylpyrophosphate amidotransferase